MKPVYHLAVPSLARIPKAMLEPASAWPFAARSFIDTAVRYGLSPKLERDRPSFSCSSRVDCGYCCQRAKLDQDIRRL